MNDETQGPGDDTLRGAYRTSQERRALDDRGRYGCVTPDELLAVLEGTLSEAERVGVLRHVGTCARCRQELELLRRAAGIAARMARPAWRTAPALAAAAGVVLVLGGVAILNRPDAPVDISRQPTTSGAAVVDLLVPAAGAVAAMPLRLIWASVPEARRYEVEVLNREGAPLFVITTRDTAAVVPDSVPLAPGGEYRWWVRAVKADGTQPASAVRRLRIAAP